MTGLEKIIDQINIDTDEICKGIKNKSIQYCKEILNSATTEAENIILNGESEANLKSSDIISRAQSAAILEKRILMLRAKQCIIKDSLKKSRNYLCSLPRDEYFELIVKLISIYSEEEQGEIYFSSDDLSRLPEDFEILLNSVAKGELIISSEPVDIDGGFILKYGGLEINCSFSAMFASQKEIFTDEISAILFTQEGHV